MPITPSTDRPESYTVDFTRDGIEFRATVITDPALYVEGDADDAVQALVDHLDGWATIDSAGKKRAENFTVTPTP